MTSRRLVSFAAAILVAATPVAPASAQGGGVTVDPDSPTGKEYAIPLESARRSATDRGGDELATQQHQGVRSAPLFGQGVGDGGGVGPAGGAPSKRAAKDQRSGKQSTTTEAGGGGTKVPDAIAGTRPVRAAVPDGGIGSAATIGAVALSVLLLGAVLGSIARRRNAG